MLIDLASVSSHYFNPFWTCHLLISVDWLFVDVLLSYYFILIWTCAFCLDVLSLSCFNCSFFVHTFPALWSSMYFVWKVYFYYLHSNLHTCVKLKVAEASPNWPPPSALTPFTFPGLAVLQVSFGNWRIIFDNFGFNSRDHCTDLC